MLRPERLRGRRVVLFGAGRENAAFARALDGVAASVVALDEGGEERLDWWRGEVGDGVELVSDPHRLIVAGAAARLEGEQAGDAPAPLPGVLAVTPGISKRHPWVTLFRDTGWEITSATAEWIAATASTVIGVTGTKGKSTTSALLRHILVASGREVAFGGNIGIPAFTLAEAPITVLELSSYQCSYLTVSPSIAVVTSLYPEHLDWHGGVAEYFADKLNILRHGAERAVINALDDTVREQVAATAPGLALEEVGTPGSFHLGQFEGEDWILLGERPLLPLAGLPLRGVHNRQNLALALAAAHAAGVPLDELAGLRDALAEFAPLEHRLEVIPDASGLDFVDDLLSTIPQATIQALESFPGRTLTVIVGGQDRGVDHAPLVEALAAAESVHAVIGLPDTGAHVVEALAGRVSVAVSVPDLAAAVRAARESTPEGGVVLLSPAAASYNRYQGHEDKAAAFRAAIAATAPGAPGS